MKNVTLLDLRVALAEITDEQDEQGLNNLDNLLEIYTPEIEEDII